MDSLDATVEKEIICASTNIVQSASRLANQRIHDLFVNYAKIEAQEEQEDEVVEVDNVCIDNNDLSVDAKIKREALRLYNNYFDLKDEEKAVVTLGLNSILDMTGSSVQKKLLSNDWHDLRHRFSRRFESHFEFEGQLNNKIAEMEKIAKQDIQQARFVCFEKEMKTANKTHSDIFSMYSQYFELMEFHSYLFEKTIDCTEADVVIKMWSPLIEKLFRREGLRTKWGESMGELVDEQQSSTNMRLVAKRRKEADKADIQVARFGSGAIKITSDKTKLFIESKMVIDHIAKEETAKAANIIVPSLQIIGSKVALFSTKLEGNGVYVAVKEGSATIPSHMLHVKDFREVIMLLYKFKAATLNLMARIQT